MRSGAIGLALLSASLATSQAAENTTYSSSPFQTVIAKATLSEIKTLPVYFSIIAGKFWSGETSGVAIGDGIYYEFSETTDLIVEGKPTTLRSGEGVFIPQGTKFTLKTGDTRPPTYLYFLLSPGSHQEHSDDPGGTTIEIYRSPSPIPKLMRESYVLSLSRVPVPPQAPPDPPHERSGAALHYIISGVGAEITEGRASAKGPGSVSYEPVGLVYQWSNPGFKSLIYLVFNLNPKGEDAVVL